MAAQEPSDAEVVDSTAEELPAEPHADDGHEQEPGPNTPPVSRELVTQPQGPGTQLIVADEPSEMIAKATTIADALKDVVVQRGMVENIKGKEHVKVEGWQTLGALLGALGGQSIYPIVIWTRRVRDEDGSPLRTTYPVKETRTKGKGKDAVTTVTEYEVDGYDWEAYVEARTPGGLVVGSAEAMCSRREKRWATADDYAIRSMAQTRATSRAMKAAAGWIVALAGYSVTPHEEMQGAQMAAALEPVAAGDVAKASRALTYLLTLDGEKAADATPRAEAVWDGIKAAHDGTMPAVVASALRTVAQMLRDARKQAAAETTTPDDDAAKGDAKE